MLISVKFKLLLYADNSALLVSGKDPQDITNVSLALEPYSKWSVDNRLSLHLGKAKAILSGMKSYETNEININNVFRGASAKSIASWTLSTGTNALWVGGPLNDTTGDNRGGYAFHETSSTPGRQAQPAVMESNMQTPTGADGKCLKFWYSMNGLSASQLRVKVKGVDATEMTTIWETRDQTRGDWKEAQALYTFNGNHTLVVEAVPASGVDPFHIFRGHVAVDDLGVRPGLECIGLCSFEGGMCDWNNARTDDFDWKLGRGTQNPITGPPRDHSSSQGDSLGGAYVYADSGFPRRPDDIARLESIEFQETDPNNPPCMRFYTFMSGRGVGTLRVILQDVVSRRERVLWGLAGNQGSQWIMAQLPLSSNTPFKVVFEASIGKPRLGDIAIDDITIISGPCATLPAVASPPTSGDCTFEEDSCGWINPKIRQRLDDLDFLRVKASEFVFPTTDHSTGSQQGFYMALESPDRKYEGDRAWLLSPVMKGQRQIKCLSFWYLLFEPLTEAEPNLGSLSAFLLREDDQSSIVLTPIWALQNFQGLTWYFGQAPLRADGDFKVVFEGVWGAANSSGTIAIDDVSIFEGNCPTIPDAAVVRAGDCTFTRGSCGWRNLTSDPDFNWSNASPIRRPINMRDHTYGSPVGYIYFDVFNLNSRSQRLQLVSPVMEPAADRSPFCFTFWFAGFGADNNTTLKLFQRPAQEDNNQLINDLTDDILIWSYKLQRTIDWQFAQVALVSGTRFQIVIEGSSYNGGYTMDDFKVYSGACARRPRDAAAIART
ncbi:MAM and LDL-receptor class A domain-containing protein 1-like [Cherax quadricarinatus]|uniref:MAM and LDL-receptor class A domain-containing protein 1-like n=1 Tax=Cherax quadricarinatus TaxID=27406 RepID=UPI00387EB25F